MTHRNIYICQLESKNRLCAVVDAVPSPLSLPGVKAEERPPSEREEWDGGKGLPWLMPWSRTALDPDAAASPAAR